jgi:hypothetical protein
MLALMLMAQEAEAPADAPYQITSVTPLRVDIGRFRNMAKTLRVATVLTPTGPVLASFVRAKRSCWDPDNVGSRDEEYSTCHYEVTLRPARPVKDPIVVLAGKHVVSDIVPLAPGPERPIGASEALVYAPVDVLEGGGTFRWTRFSDGVFLVYAAEPTRNVDAPGFELSSCTQRPIDIFKVVRCPAGAELLYDHDHAVLGSFAEYSDAATLPLNRLRVDGNEAVLVRVGLRAEVVIGMIVKQADGWRLAIRGPDYATMY